MNNKMKNAIILTGYPGSGKTTLARYLSEKMNYIHYEYDIEIQKPKLSEVDGDVVMDAFFKDTNGVFLIVDSYIKQGYSVMVIHLDIDKNRCLSNIYYRGRPTIDITNFNLYYNWAYLKSVLDFKLIQINDYIDPSMVLREIINPSYLPFRYVNNTAKTLNITAKPLFL